MSPYSEQPARAFWKTAMAGQDPGRLGDLYRRKFEIRPQDRIATAGSCFARHLSGALGANGYRVMDVEPGPPWLDDATLRAHGYGLFSARYGHIYTARQLLQLAREAFGEGEPCEIAWTRKGRWYDAHRPGVDPNGLESEEEVRALRADHLAHVREMFETLNVFAFTLGLTEAWQDAAATTVFPTAPGTIAGTWDEARYRFVNFTAAEVLDDLRAFRALLARHNRHARMIVSVSPVALTATATDEHVLTASTGAKAVLRAAAGELAATDPGVDYFPAFELIASPATRGIHFGADMRTVSEAGAAAAMDLFFSQHPPLDGPAAADGTDDFEFCEEELLEAFAR